MAALQPVGSNLDLSAIAGARHYDATPQGADVTLPGPALIFNNTAAAINVAITDIDNKTLIWIIGPRSTGAPPAPVRASIVRSTGTDSLSAQSIIAVI